MNQKVDQSIIDKIKKLLDHHAGCLKIKSEAEAMTAMDMAKKLMEQHHLDMMQFSENTEFDITHKQFDKCSVYVVPIWLTNIINTVNNICNCSCILEKDKQQNGYIHIKVVFVSLTSEIDRVYAMYMFLKKTTHRLANLHVKRICGNYTNWRSFAEGFTSRLLERSRLDILKRNKESYNVAESMNDEFEDCEDDEIKQSNNKDLVVQEKSNEIQLYEYLENVKDKIKDYIDNNINNVKYEEIKTTSKVLKSSYDLGRKLADKQNMTIIGKSHQLTLKTRKTKNG
jgi:hypothetical protein